jgi:hypothetical protein
MNETQAKLALDHIAAGLEQGPMAKGIGEWFISASIFKQAIDSLKQLGIGYDKLLGAVSFIFQQISKYGPDIATIVNKIVEEGKAIFYPGT